MSVDRIYAVESSAFPSYDEIKKLPNKVLLWCGTSVHMFLCFSNFWYVRAYVSLSFQFLVSPPRVVYTHVAVELM